jgi:hypothetical protein
MTAQVIRLPVDIPPCESCGTRTIRALVWTDPADGEAFVVCPNCAGPTLDDEFEYADAIGANDLHYTDDGRVVTGIEDDAARLPPWGTRREAVQARCADGHRFVVTHITADEDEFTFEEYGFKAVSSSRAQWGRWTATGKSFLLLCDGCMGAGLSWRESWRVCFADGIR